jgi:ribose transport system permease protein
MLKKIKPFVPLLMLLFLCVAIGLIAPRFLSVGNFVRITSSASVPLILICGQTFIILIGSIDLSLEGTLAVAAVMVGLLGQWVGGTAFVLLAFPIAIVGGSMIGFLNGAVHVYLKVPSLLTSLGFGFAGLGLATVLADGGSITITDPLLRYAVFHRLLGFPMSAWIGLAALLVALYVQDQTRLGRWAYVLGGGEEVAKLSGIPIQRVRVALFVMAGAFFGLGGAVLGSQLGLGQIQITTGYLFTTITAVVVGGTTLTGGVGGILNSIVGVFVIMVLANGMVLMGIPTSVQLGLQGLLTIAAVAISLDRKRLVAVK